MCPDPPRGSHLRRWYLITPLNKYSCQCEHPSKNLSYGPVLLGYFKTLSVGAVWGSKPRSPAQQTGALPTELTRRRFKGT